MGQAPFPIAMRSGPGKRIVTVRTKPDALRFSQLTGTTLRPRPGGPIHIGHKRWHGRECKPSGGLSYSTGKIAHFMILSRIKSPFKIRYFKPSTGD